MLSCIWYQDLDIKVSYYNVEQAVLHMLLFAIFQDHKYLLKLS